jgi:hypothetical protein
MSRHIRVDHAQVAATLREQPGKWLTVGEYRNTSSVDTVAHLIRTGRQYTGTRYQPAGAFEARTQLTDDGTLLEARYVGAQPKHPASVSQSLDTERVLGQIQRGELRCGPGAAREIADRHEAAYGDAFHGSPAEALLNSLAWGEALASLTFREVA